MTKPIAESRLGRRETAGVPTPGRADAASGEEAGTRFVCRVGGDYRAAYGVIVNEREAAITEYTGFSRYRVLIRKVSIRSRSSAARAFAEV